MRVPNQPCHWCIINIFENTRVSVYVIDVFMKTFENTLVEETQTLNSKHKKFGL